MADASIEAQFSASVAAVAGVLKPRGFKKQGRAFRRTSHGNLELVAFQRSVSNDAHNLRFTLNVGIVSDHLAKQDGVDASKVGIFEAHLRKRIGTFLSETHDKWWRLSTETEADQAIKEVIDLLTEKVVPYLDEHSSDAALIQLWKNGQGPGLTNTERLRYLSTLEASTHNGCPP